ncbi:MAG: WYL domain-containing protein [Flavobacteriales bacterium]|nr:WYL domain-containing protein [Flavobacteriales bacterium]
MAYSRIYNRHGYILDFIKRNNHPRTKDIIDFLHGLGEGVDARTVQRDIKTIENELDYIIERKGTHPNKWYEITAEPDEQLLVNRYLEHVGFAEILRQEAVHEKKGRKAVFLDEMQLTRGLEYISPILSAIRSNRKLEIAHQKFGADATRGKVSPLFLKQFRHRWYLIAREEQTEKVKSFGLDRISAIEMLNESFKFRNEDDHDAMYSHVIGLYENENESQTIQIWSEMNHAGYLRSVKIHHSQREIGEQDTGIIFEVNLVPNYEFFQQILMMEARVKILSPTAVQQRMKAILMGILARYK